MCSFRQYEMSTKKNHCLLQLMKGRSDYLRNVGIPFIKKQWLRLLHRVAKEAAVSLTKCR